MTAHFRDFNLPESFLAALDQRGFTEPTPVQEQVLSQPDLHRDMVVQARVFRRARIHVLQCSLSCASLVMS